MKIPTYPDILGAVARGWCSSENEKKTMDPVLAEAISKEIGTLLHKEQPTMIKRVMLPITLMLLVAATGCQTAQPTAWFLSGSDVDSEDNRYVGRLGVEQGDLEFGAQSDWVGVHGERQTYGAYALLHLPWDENLLGTQYTGFQTSIAVDHEDGGSYGFLAGTLKPLSEDVDAVAEYRYSDFTGAQKDQHSNDVHWFGGGLRFKF